MPENPPDRNAIADTLYASIVALQDHLTHLWGAVLAVEVVDHAPVTDEKREQVLTSLKAIHTTWQEKQSALDDAFPRLVYHHWRTAP